MGHVMLGRANGRTINMILAAYTYEIPMVVPDEKRKEKILDFYIPEMISKGLISENHGIKIIVAGRSGSGY